MTDERQAGLREALAAYVHGDDCTCPYSVEPTDLEVADLLLSIAVRPDVRTRRLSPVAAAIRAEALAEYRRAALAVAQVPAEERLRELQQWVGLNAMNVDKYPAGTTAVDAEELDAWLRRALDDVLLPPARGFPMDAQHHFEHGGLLSTTCARPDCMQAPAALRMRGRRHD